jgi:hypothetical protein
MAAALGACSPALDWREVRVAGTSLVIEMPCRPDSQERQVPLAGPPVRLVMQACDAEGLTWGLLSADVGDPARVEPALAALLSAAAANIGAVPGALLGGSPGAGGPMSVKGSTPHAGSLQVALNGHRPQGPVVQMKVAVFAQGTRVYQMTALGEKLPIEALGIFLGSARFNP